MIVKRKVAELYWKTQVAVGSFLVPLVAVAGPFDGDASGFSYGKDMGQVATGLKTQTSDVGVLLLSLAQVAGVFFALAGVSDIKKNHDAPGQGYASKGAVKLGAGVLGYFLPHFIGMGGQTIFP